MHNQTDPEWLKLDNEKGTGLFLIPDVNSSDYHAVKKVFIKDISYQEANRRGSLVPVFKWIPPSIASFEDLRTQMCGTPCVDTCVQPGCACFNGLCK